MRPTDFKRWRKALSLSQKEAAEALGLKRRVVQYYEKGERDGEEVRIPRTVELACWALLHNRATDWGSLIVGPEPEADAKDERKGKAKKAGKKKKMKKHGDEEALDAASHANGALDAGEEDALPPAPPSPHAGKSASARAAAKAAMNGAGRSRKSVDGSARLKAGGAAPAKGPARKRRKAPAA
ncbi:MAG: helix-turn-helix transcriptional regulator [Alphaproteobacteria bacterium]|nr:helix-turn-helix transcriptional regulator [Alphaproteobacteria bacterium]